MQNSGEQVVIHTPFSPTILEYQVPQRFIDIINTSGDAVLPDDGLSKSLISLTILWVRFLKKLEYQWEKDDRNYMSDIIKRACLGYLQNMIANSRAYEWRKMVDMVIQPLIIFTLHNLGS